jgi:hypothetical protein
MNKLITLLAASSLAGCNSGSKPDYFATFEGKDLGCCILRDTFHKPPRPLAEGQSKADETADWITKDGKLGMVLRAPAPIKPNTTPSMGIFSTGHNLGPGSRFTISATFQKPAGTPSGKAWSVGVVGRTGGVDDTADLRRILLSFRTCTTGIGPCAGAKANLRVLEVNSADPDDPANAKPASVNIPSDLYDAISASGQPFTLKLTLDRKAGSGTAALTSGKVAISLAFKPTIFKADSGDAIKTLGATLANGFGEGEQVSVEVNDLAIWAH